MCKYSLEGYKNRDVKKGEKLIVGSHYSGHAGTLSPEGNDRIVACVPHEATLTIENVQLAYETVAFKPHEEDGPFDRYDRFLRGHVERVTLNDLVGTRQVVTLLDGNETETGYDYILFADGRAMCLSHIAKGTVVYEGERPTLEDKLGLDEKSLVVAALDMPPEPKPEDDQPEPEEPKEPAVRVPSHFSIYTV